MARTISPYKDAEAALQTLIKERRSVINYLTRTASEKRIDQLIKLDAAISILKQAIKEEPSEEYQIDSIYDFADPPEDA